ncbi:MAG: PilW family protein [Ahniella sp.]|nr:PilW family protein [Ahniella sp.]
MPGTAVRRQRPPLSFAAGDLALITNCNSAQVFEATASGNSLIPSDTTDGGALRNRIDTFVTAGDDAGGSFTGGDSRVFNFTKDFRTVTYFLALRTDRDDAGGTRRISTLVRQVNGSAQALTDGVERLEIRYGVEANDGSIRFLTAQQVQAAPTVDCPPYPADLKSQEPGCMWRSVRVVDVSLLLNSVASDAPSERERFSFTFDNQNEIEAPATLPSGLPRERMFRREFRTTVMLRNAGI